MQRSQQLERHVKSSTRSSSRIARCMLLVSLALCALVLSTFLELRDWYTVLKLKLPLPLGLMILLPMPLEVLVFIRRLTWRSREQMVTHPVLQSKSSRKRRPNSQFIKKNLKICEFLIWMLTSYLTFTHKMPSKIYLCNDLYIVEHTILILSSISLCLDNVFIFVEHVSMGVESKSYYSFLNKFESYSVFLGKSEIWVHNLDNSKSDGMMMYNDSIQIYTRILLHVWFCIITYVHCTKQKNKIWLILE